MGMVGQLDSMKLDFVSHVPYELRTPLTSIKAASSMLLEGGFGHSPIATDAGPPKTILLPILLRKLLQLP